MRVRLGTKAAAEFMEACRVPLKVPACFELDAPLGIDVTIEPVKPKRSLDQNARYWKIVGALADYAGMTKGELHEEVLSEFGGYDLVEFRGSVRKRPKMRSSQLRKLPFSELMAIAERWAAEMQVSWNDDDR